MYDNEMPTICQSAHPKQTKDKRECDENLLTCGYRFQFHKKVIGLNVLEPISIVVDKNMLQVKNLLVFRYVLEMCILYTCYDLVPFSALANI